VKQWLTAKLNFAPPVIRLSNPEFQMRGGRIDVIKNRQVATLVYEGSKDMITLFLWPSAGQPLGAGDWSVSGYHAFTWNAAGYFFCGRFLFK
jgi:anti-sigma factor RsiW